MPYKQFTTYAKGRKWYATKNLKTGQIIHYSSPEKRATGIKMREAFASGWVPSHLRTSKRGRLHGVRGYRK